MSQKTFLFFIGILFLAKVLFILVWMTASGWLVTLNGWQMPMWLMVIGLVVDAFISWQAFKFAKRV